jgi:putative ABC transport system substrate-binding protein
VGVNRRNFVGIGIGLVAAPMLVAAQPQAKVRRIGLLILGDFDDAQRTNIRAELAERGWIEGKNLIVESRSAKHDLARLPSLADELVKLNVELIIGAGTPASQAAKAATTRIPIVIYASGDPVVAGLVPNLTARPDSNITGVTLMAPEVSAKRLQILRELVPSATRVGVLTNPTNPLYRAMRSAEERAARSLGLQLIFVEVSQPSERDASVAALAKRGAQALVIPPDSLFMLNSTSLLAAARRYRLPTALDNMGEKDDALFAYGPHWGDVDRRLAGLVDRVLKGARPADLPIEQPTRFWLTINLRNAKALGIKVPQSFLHRADEVFQ